MNAATPRSPTAWGPTSFAPSHSTNQPIAKPSRASARSRVLAMGKPCQGRVLPESHVLACSTIAPLAGNASMLAKAAVSVHQSCMSFREARPSERPHHRALPMHRT